MDDKLTLENFENFTGPFALEHWRSMYHLIIVANANDESLLAWRAMMELSED